MPTTEAATETTPSRPRRFAELTVVALSLTLVIGVFAVLAAAQSEEELDPARSQPLACELVSTPGAVPRAALDMVHLANVCGIVGTDVEFQSRTDSAGGVHDYAFVGTMGFGFRIYDVTTPAAPTIAGGFADSGWQNDVQVRGDVVVSTFDGIVGEPSTASTCLTLNHPTALGQGVDIFLLDFDPDTATFDISNPTCVANPPGGAHNSTLHPSGDWLAISNCCSDWAMDLVDLGDLANGNATHTYRFIDARFRGSTSRCPAGATFTCVFITRPDGSDATNLWRPHDIHFSEDGNTMYVAAINSTFIVDVSDARNGNVSTIAIIPNADPGDPDASADINISHQADVTSDGNILVVTDENGGGLGNTACNVDPDGAIGAMHFFALAPVAGRPDTDAASPANPVKIGFYVNPNPTFAPDPLQDEFDQLPRAERACTIHVFRLGGNGSASPGPIQPGLDGVSRLPGRELVTAWYGAGVWYLDISSPPSDADGVAEDPRSTWGNTLGFIVMPGADTWSAKEYKGHIYAGDIARGFDVYGFADCEDPIECTIDPVLNAPPVAQDDAATVSRGGSVVVDVLANDTDPNGDPLTIQSFTQGAHGTVSDNFDGTLTYTHDGSATSSDSFEYTVSDGRGGADTATVLITVQDGDDDGARFKVTGGGYLKPDSGKKINFGFNAAQKADGLHGHLTLNDKSAGVKIRLDEVQSLSDVIGTCGSIDPGPNAAQFTGEGTFNGSPASFRVCVEDNGEPGSGDELLLHCTSGCSYSTAERTPDDVIDGGNIQVHRSDDGGGSQPSQEAGVVVLDPLLLTTGAAGTPQVLLATAYDGAGDLATGATITLTWVAADGSTGSQTGLTDALGVAVFTVTLQGGDTEYLAWAGDLSSNAIDITGLL